MVSTHALQGSVDGLAVDSTNSCRLFLVNHLTQATISGYTIFA